MMFCGQNKTIIVALLLWEVQRSPNEISIVVYNRYKVINTFMKKR